MNFWIKNSIRFWLWPFNRRMKKKCRVWNVGYESKLNKFTLIAITIKIDAGFCLFILWIIWISYSATTKNSTILFYTFISSAIGFRSCIVRLILQLSSNRIHSLGEIYNLKKKIISFCLKIGSIWIYFMYRQVISG